MEKLITEKHKRDLNTKGYTVVEHVLTDHEADTYRAVYSDWLSSSFQGTFPHSIRSLVQRYRVGHMEPTWAIRNTCKPVFEGVWNTANLLSSFDAVAIGRPPEDGEEDFHAENRHWLHIDQGSERMGLHAFQGAVYLETCDVDDWTFEVIEGSHEYHDRYYDECDYAVEKRKGNPTWRHKNLRLEDIEYFTEECGLQRTRVPVPKGGMVLWDSRLVHANARPVKGRRNPGRWRYVVFVCMTPAKWSDEKSLEDKRKAYEHMRMTIHWPSNDIGLFSEDLPSYAPKDPNPITELPPSARTDVAKRLAGVMPYPDAHGVDDDVIETPKWRTQFLDDLQTTRETFDMGLDTDFLRRRMITFTVLGVILALIVANIMF